MADLNASTLYLYWISHCLDERIGIWLNREKERELPGWLTIQDSNPWRFLNG